MNLWIVYNGFLPGKAFIDYAQMLQEAAIELGHEAFLLSNEELTPVLAENRKQIIHNRKRPDAVLFTDKDIYLARQLENESIPVFNQAEAIEVSDDKIKTYQALYKNNVPIPKTIIAPKTFGFTKQIESKFIEKLESNLSYPLIIKEAFGSFGEQVYLIKHRQALIEKMKTLIHVPYLFQEFIHTSIGEDKRIQVVGDEVVTAMQRKSATDFRSNITAGGTMNPYSPTSMEEDVAIQASQAIGAHFSGVDLLLGSNNEPIVCEVNSNAHIRNLYDCTGINAAFDIVKYVTRRIEKEKNK
ncbi:MAG TPA: RimK family alpha-L-glutamate ligase [Pseudogracilibacillus sp.]|nr:RimK family alpha-L-glutamate ligase [Pseudogracilibacillus sp.]